MHTTHQYMAVNVVLKEVFIAGIKIKSLSISS